MFLKSYVPKSKKLDAAKELEANVKFLTVNKSQPGVVTTASGLQYKVITEGKGPKPTLTDNVKVAYRGTTVDGKEFDKNAGISFPITGVIKGWTEGLQLMSVGSKYMLFIPYDLGYGEQGN
jgi:FKBP-type peptidyl-prolyl cis-trans isomerase FklB